MAVKTLSVVSMSAAAFAAIQARIADHRANRKSGTGKRGKSAPWRDNIFNAVFGVGTPFADLELSTDDDGNVIPPVYTFRCGARDMVLGTTGVMIPRAQSIANYCRTLGKRHGYDFTVEDFTVDGKGECIVIRLPDDPSKIEVVEEVEQVEEEVPA